MKKNKTILVVEDENTIRGAIVDILLLNNFEVIEATNGEEAVGLALDHHPDMILMDIIMPIMDGMTALKKIRQDDWGQNVPVIILTNQNATDEQLVEDMAIHKPICYLIKSDWKIHDVVKEVISTLGK